jgi:hypothetical protein
MVESQNSKTGDINDFLASNASRSSWTRDAGCAMSDEWSSVVLEHPAYIAAGGQQGCPPLDAAHVKPVSENYCLED